MKITIDIDVSEALELFKRLLALEIPDEKPTGMSDVEYLNQMYGKISEREAWRHARAPVNADQDGELSIDEEWAAINKIADIMNEEHPELLTEQLTEVDMDTAGIPTKFKNRCSICGEPGRNSRSHREEMRDGTYHWVLQKTSSEEE